MPENAAAWFVKKYGKLEVKPAPYTPARENEIVVRNRAVAVNPVDWAIPLMPGFMFSWIKSPCVLGEDLAGEVVEIGKGVTRFKVGDRVLGMALGTSKERTSAAEGAFQNYTVLVEHMVAPIPDTMSYESAAVLPLCLSTASCGLFQKDHLALQNPSVAPKPAGKTLLVWGGSTSVGSNAIQLAVAAGYDVITTASPRNFDYVKKLGAREAFDYNSKTVVKDIIKALKGKTIAGALAIGAGSPEACLKIVRKCKGNRFVSSAGGSIGLDALPEDGRLSLSLIFRFLWSGVSNALKYRMSGVGTKFIFGDTLAFNEVGRIIYVDFLPQALAQGKYVAAPEPHVVGKGLDFVQTGFDVQRKGVSAKKVVVSL
jgi:NADPH:quinone reductase-like Zn-dependent oxidoreductase